MNNEFRSKNLKINGLRYSILDIHDSIFYSLYICLMEKFLKELFNNQSYDEKNFFLIAGPCVVETEELVMEVAEKVSAICEGLGIPYVLKASYRKANRTSGSSFTGIGDEAALEILHKAGLKFRLPTTSDIHAHDEADIAANHVDILQIPAFLCRQTDVLVSAADARKT